MKNIITPARALYLKVTSVITALLIESLIIAGKLPFDSIMYVTLFLWVYVVLDGFTGKK